MRPALFMLITLAAIAAKAQTTIYIVRHAEKQETGTDPELSQQGRKRAGELARVLKDVDIRQVYATPYNRTRQTVTPLAEARGLKILEYNPMVPDELISIIRSAGKANLLVAGHSNTVPMLLNRLTGINQYLQLDESDYDNLYIVHYTSNEVAVHALEYGPDNPN